jgi:hypothetical protein
LGKAVKVGCFSYFYEIILNNMPTVKCRQAKQEEFSMKTWLLATGFWQKNAPITPMMDKSSLILPSARCQKLIA